MKMAAPHDTIVNQMIARSYPSRFLNAVRNMSFTCCTSNNPLNFVCKNKSIQSIWKPIFSCIVSSYPCTSISDRTLIAFLYEEEYVRESGKSTRRSTRENKRCGRCIVQGTTTERTQQKTNENCRLHSCHSTIVECKNWFLSMHRLELSSSFTWMPDSLGTKCRWCSNRVMWLMRTCHLILILEWMQVDSTMDWSATHWITMRSMRRRSKWGNILNKNKNSSN